MGFDKLSPDDVILIRAQIKTNAIASQRFAKLGKIAWRDAAIVELMLMGVSPQEIGELLRKDLRFYQLTIAPKWGGRRTITLDRTTREYLDHYLDGEEERLLLFVNQRGKPVGRRTLEQMISKLGKQINRRLTPWALTRTGLKFEY